MSTYRLVVDTALDLITEEATTGTDGFRDWVLPYRPCYDLNPEVRAEVEAGALRGLSALQILADVVARHG